MHAHDVEDGDGLRRHDAVAVRHGVEDEDEDAQREDWPAQPQRHRVARVQLALAGRQDEPPRAPQPRHAFLRPVEPGAGARGQRLRRRARIRGHLVGGVGRHGLEASGLLGGEADRCDAEGQPAAVVGIATSGRRRGRLGAFVFLLPTVTLLQHDGARGQGADQSLGHHDEDLRGRAEVNSGNQCHEQERSAEGEQALPGRRAAEPLAWNIWNCCRVTRMPSDHTYSVPSVHTSMPSSTATSS